MTRAMTILATLAGFTGCIHEDEAPPPPVTSTGGSDTLPPQTTGVEGGEESTTGAPSCDPEYAEYQCRGFMGCVYRSPSGSTFRYFNEVPGVGNTVECADYSIADAFEVCAPYAEAPNFTNPAGDVAALYKTNILDECETSCEAHHAGYFAAMPGTINYSGTAWTKDHCSCHFEFQPDGRGDDGSSGAANAAIPLGMCEYIDQVAPLVHVDQVQIAGPCEDDPADDECPVPTCGGWDPLKWTATSSSCTGSGGLPCSTIDTDLWTGIFADTFDLIECDIGRWVQHDGPPEWHDWAALAPGDFFYEIGLRNGDISKRVKIGANWYPITTDAELTTAFEALNGATTFTLETKRGAVTQQRWIRIQQCPTAGC